MSIKLNAKYTEDFVSKSDLESIAPEIKKAHKTLTEKSGAGNDFLGWVDLPENYDKEEFERIKKAAEKIRSDSQVLIVIGIGGSYLGARAAVEFCKSQNYNLVCKDTPLIFFTGNSISSSALSDIVSHISSILFSGISASIAHAAERISASFGNKVQRHALSVL